MIWFDSTLKLYGKLLKVSSFMYRNSFVIKYRIYPIIPALFLILFASYYSQNYSSIMYACLSANTHEVITCTPQKFCTFNILCYKVHDN